jgi:hypothetical protein
VAHRVISQSQTAFIKGRFIKDGALALHEIIHELHSRNLPAVLLKLDFEKAYDRVEGFRSIENKIFPTEANKKAKI